MKKFTITATGVAILALIGGYMAWPAEGVPVSNGDTLTQKELIYERLIHKLPFLENTSFDKREYINGVKVPPMPDPKINDATLLGVDSDNNGVRDDIDRMIAEIFGNDQRRYQDAVKFQVYDRIALANPTPENVHAFALVLECIDMEGVYDEFDAIERATLDTPERQRTAGQTYAGMSVGVGISECTQ